MLRILLAAAKSTALADFAVFLEKNTKVMQLPVAAGAKDAQIMLQLLETVEVLMTL
jgi:hypothetical protein